MAANADADDDSKAEGTTCARRASQGGKAALTPRAGRQALPLLRGAQPLTPSPTRPAISFRTHGPQPAAARDAGSSSAAAGPRGRGSPDPSLRSAPASSPDNFWRLLPVSEGSRRNSAAAAGDGQADAAAAAAAPPPPSWLASTPSSVQTVKNIKSPLTPFPPWEDGSDDGHGGSETELAQEPDRADVGMPRAAFVERRCALNAAVHGAVLVGQITVTLAVASVFVAVTVWKKGDTQPRFWDMLWTYVQPALGLVLAMCVGTLLAHETRVLSTVAMLYLQALILTVTTAASLAAWAWLLAQDTGQLAKGVVVGGVTMMMGTAVFAFFRTALVWWVAEDRGEFADYGTFEE